MEEVQVARDVHLESTVIRAVYKTKVNVNCALPAGLEQIQAKQQLAVVQHAALEGIVVLWDLRKIPNVQHAPTANIAR
jgi:hypothetical protein